MSDRSSDPSDVIFEIRVQPLNGEAAFTVRADPYDTIFDLKTRISEYKSANNSATSSETKDGDDIPVERLLLYKDGVTLEDFGLFSMYEIYNKDTLNLWDCAWRDEDYREPPATTPIKLDCNSVDVSDQYAVATFINSLFKNKRRGSVVGTLVQRDGSFRVPGYEDVKDQFLPLLSQFEKMEDKKLALRTLDEFMWTFRTAWKTGGSTDEVKREMGDLWARLFVESELNDQEAKDELKTTEKCLHGIAFDRDVVHAFIKRARQGETLESSHPVVQWLMDRFSGYPDTKIFNALLELGGPLRENQIKQDLLSVCRQFENEEDGHLAYPQLLGIYLQEGQEEDALRFMEKERKEDYYYDLKNYVNEVPYVCLTQASSVKRNFEACIQKLVEDLDELQGIKVEDLRNSYTEDKKDEYAHVLSRGIEGDNDNVDTAEITTGGANMDSEISDIPISNVTAWLALLHRSCQVLSFRFGGENPDSSQDWKSVAHQIEEDIRSVVAQNPNAKFLAQIADAVVPQLRFRWRSFFELLEALSKQQEDEEVFMIITKVAFKKRLSSAGLDRRSSIVGLAKRRSSIFGMERVPESTPLSI